jgi:glycosyltransferase involved in cell wall biosynthesis
MRGQTDSLRKAKFSLKRSLSQIEREIGILSKHKPRILYVCPHLSTGGMPQYLYKCIESLNDQAEIYCLEYNNVSDDFVVQRNRIQNLLGDRYLRIDGGDKSFFLEILDDICPDVIHFQDFVEFFIEDSICQKIFSYDRPWFIFETCHSSNVKPDDKFWAPDKLVMVNQWMVDRFQELGIDLDILEYPIEDFQKIPQSEAQQILGLDPSVKHVINIGLFTSGKNQGELINYAKDFIGHPVQFHFIGNQAANFRDYWEPLMRELPENCRIWGERSDTDLFYQAADLFVFTSTWELNPIVIKESLSWKLPILMRRLPPYMSQYDENSLVHYLSKDNLFYDREFNVRKIKEILGLSI